MAKLDRDDAKSLPMTEAGGPAKLSLYRYERSEICNRVRARTKCRCWSEGDGIDYLVHTGEIGHIGL